MGWVMIGVALAGAAMSPGPVEAEERALPFLYNARGHRDPFEALVRDGRVVGVVHQQQRSFNSAKPTLYAILWDPVGSSFAIINNVEVGVGDTIESYRVADITQDTVVLKAGEERVVLQINFESSSSRRSSTVKEGGEGSP